MKYLIKIINFGAKNGPVGWNGLTDWAPLLHMCHLYLWPIPWRICHHLKWSITERKI